LVLLLKETQIQSQILRFLPRVQAICSGFYCLLA